MNRTILQEGDNVSLIKDPKVKITSTMLKRSTMVCGIHLTDDLDEVECWVKKVKGLVLYIEVLKRVCSTNSEEYLLIRLERALIATARIC